MRVILFPAIVLPIVHQKKQTEVISQFLSMACYNILKTGTLKNHRTNRR